MCGRRGLSYGGQPEGTGRISFGEGQRNVAKEIIEHATPTGEPSFIPSYRKTSQSLGTIINQRLNISGVIKDIFLKGTKRNVLHSRSPISRKTLLDEGIDLFELDLDLLRAGVPTVPKSGMTTKVEK